MNTYPRTPLTTLRRVPARGSYDLEVVHAILDEALVCHVAFTMDGQPFAIPTTFARVHECLYVHGAAASRMLREAASEFPVCITVTLIDGLVYSRSWFHHSMNYRSVVMLGHARNVTESHEKWLALEAIVNRAGPGRASVTRAPTTKELSATRVLAMPLDQVSAKLRTGGPVEDDGDTDPNAFSGYVPLCIAASAPIAAPDTSAAIPPLPPAIAKLTA